MCHEEQLRCKQTLGNKVFLLPFFSGLWVVLFIYRYDCVMNLWRKPNFLSGFYSCFYCHIFKLNPLVEGPHWCPFGFWTPPKSWGVDHTVPEWAMGNLAMFLFDHLFVPSVADCGHLRIMFSDIGHSRNLPSFSTEILGHQSCAHEPLRACLTATPCQLNMGMFQFFRLKSTTKSAKPWETVGKPWGNHGETVGKPIISRCRSGWHVPASLKFGWGSLELPQWRSSPLLAPFKL